MDSDGSSSEREHAWEYQTGGVFKCQCGRVRLLGHVEPEPEEAPLTPDEEEELPEDRAVAVDDFGQPIRECYACDRVGCAGCAPTQSERRPPYAVDYATEGGLAYQLLLSGDAQAIAEDGVLKIRHDGPVLGIVRVQPVQMESHCA